MTDKQRSLCIAEVQNYKDRDSYISDLSLSSIWGDDPETTIPQERLEKLGSIYDACHRSARDIASASGMSHRKLAERFSIPYRTMEDWCSRKSKCPVYIRLMMQECLGLIKK